MLLEERTCRILLVEDHILVRDALKTMLTRAGGCEVVAEAADGLEAMRAFREFRPDLILLDLSLPKMDGLSVLKNLRAERTETRVIILTMYEEEGVLFEALKLGADGYCLKQAGKEELLLAVSSVLEGKMFISPGILSKVMNVLLREGAETREGPLQGISSREREVLKLIGEGYRVGEIADYLCISKRTVERHRYNIMKKLGLHKTSELVAFAIRNGIVVDFQMR